MWGHTGLRVDSFVVSSLCCLVDIFLPGLDRLGLDFLSCFLVRKVVWWSFFVKVVKWPGVQAFLLSGRVQNDVDGGVVGGCIGNFDPPGVFGPSEVVC